MSRFTASGSLRTCGVIPLLTVLIGSGSSVRAESPDLPPSPAPYEVVAQVELPAPAPAASAPAPQNARASELWQDKPLKNLTATIKPELPESEKLSPAEVSKLGLAKPVLGQHPALFSSMGDSRPWMLATYEWEAPATRHLPLFLEEPNLERLGYTFSATTILCEEGSVSAGPVLQPFISGVHFFGRLPLAPYLAGLDEPCEPIYTLGVDRPGSPVPYRRHYLPLSLRGAIYEAAATIGLLYIIP